MIDDGSAIAWCHRLGKLADRLNDSEVGVGIYGVVALADEVAVNGNGTKLIFVVRAGISLV